MSYRFFEILPGIAAWITLLGLIFFSWQLPAAVVIFIVLYDLYWFLKVGYLFFHLRFSFSELRKNMKIDWLAKLRDERGGSWERIRHLVVIPMYHEPHEIIRESILSIAGANYPKDKIMVVLALEERGGEGDKRAAERIKEEFGNTFGEFLITIHPAGISGELPGKGSNETWAVKKAKKEFIDPQNIPYKDILISVFDSDTRPGKDYFGVLSYKFLASKNPERSSYQPIPLFTNNIYHVSMFARLIGFSATFWQLMQQARAEQLVTFSSHSMPFETLVKIGYWHTDIVSEDSRIFFQCLLYHNGDWRVEPMLYPIFMDAVSGSNFWEAMKNLYKQQRRWAWGIENFAYIMHSFWKRSDIPARVKRFWAFRTFDGFFSWSTSSFIIFMFGWLPNIIGGDVFSTTIFSYNLPRVTGWLINLASLGIITSALLSIILLPPRPQGFKIYHILLYLAQWFLMPFTFIIFGSAPALEAQTRLMLSGKFRLGFWKTPKKKESS